MAAKKDDVKQIEEVEKAEVVEINKPDCGLIYEAISKTMKDIGAVGKNDTNQQQKFKYRGIDAVMNALNPAMIKNEIFVVPEILEQKREERTSKNGGLLIYSICTIRYKFYAKDGSFVEAVVIGEGMDSGDKATNKAMSIAFKYACFQVFCIPTEEMEEADSTTPPDIAPDYSETNNQPVTEVYIKSLENKIAKKGLHVESICGKYKVNQLSELNFGQYTQIMSILDKSYPDKVEDK